MTRNERQSGKHSATTDRNLSRTATCLSPPSETVVVKMSHVPVGPEGTRATAETFAPGSCVGLGSGPDVGGFE